MFGRTIVLTKCAVNRQSRHATRVVPCPSSSEVTMITTRDAGLDTRKYNEASRCGPAISQSRCCARRSPPQRNRTKAFPTITITPKQKHATTSSICFCAKQAGRSTNRKIASFPSRECRTKKAKASSIMFCGARTGYHSRWSKQNDEEGSTNRAATGEAFQYSYPACFCQLSFIAAQPRQA